MGKEKLASSVTAITHGSNPIYLTTIVPGAPGSQEDYQMGKAVEGSFLPLARA
jgi:UbiD family decarboxylase